MYLIKHAIGLDPLNIASSGSNKDLIITNNNSKAASSKYNSSEQGKTKKVEVGGVNQRVSKKPQISTKQQSRQKQKVESQSVGLTKTLNQAKSVQKFEEINL